MADKKRKKREYQDFKIPRNDYGRVGRAGGTVSGVPWYSLYYGIGFGGWNGIYGTGYGNGTAKNETAQNNYGQETSGDGTTGSDTGAGAGEGSGMGTM